MNADANPAARVVNGMRTLTPYFEGAAEANPDNIASYLGTALKAGKTVREDVYGILKTEAVELNTIEAASINELINTVVADFWKRNNELPNELARTIAAAVTQTGVTGESIVNRDLLFHGIDIAFDISTAAAVIPWVMESNIETTQYVLTDIIRNLREVSEQAMSVFDSAALTDEERSLLRCSLVMAALAVYRGCWRSAIASDTEVDIENVHSRFNSVFDSYVNAVMVTARRAGVAQQDTES